MSKHFIVLVLVALSCFGCAATPPDCIFFKDGLCAQRVIAYMPPAIPSPITRLAIFPTTKSRAAGIPSSLQEEIQARLEGAMLGVRDFMHDFTLVERERLDIAFRELAFQASGSVRDDTFVGAGRMLGADHVLIYQTSVEFSSDATQSLITSDATQFGIDGGIVHGRTTGKIIHVQTGTIVFQQTAEQFTSFAKPKNRTYWKKPALDATRTNVAMATLNGFCTSLIAAMSPFPDGYIIHPDHWSGKVVVHTVLIGGPGHSAGLREGDVIKAIDGISVNSTSDPVFDSISDWKPRAPYTITVDRNGREETFIIRKVSRLGK